MKTEYTKHLLFELVHRIKTTIMKELRSAEINLTPMHLIVLRNLSKYGEQSQQQIACRLNRDKAQIARVVTELERKGLISKTQDPGDKRCIKLCINHESKECLQKFTEIEKNIIGQLLEGFSDEDTKAFTCTLERIHMNWESVWGNMLLSENRGNCLLDNSNKPACS